MTRRTLRKTLALVVVLLAIGGAIAGLATNDHEVTIRSSATNAGATVLDTTTSSSSSSTSTTTAQVPPTSVPTPTSRSSSVARPRPAVAPTPPAPPATGATARATWYDSGSGTANGERFNPDGLTFAHRSMAFGTTVRFCHGGRCVVARCNDRGPFADGASFDLSRGTFASIASLGSGVITVTWEVV